MTIISEGRKVENKLQNKVLYGNIWLAENAHFYEIITVSLLRYGSKWKKTGENKIVIFAFPLRECLTPFKKQKCSLNELQLQAPVYKKISKIKMKKHTNSLPS